MEVVGQPATPKFKGRQKSAGRKGGQTPNNQEQVQLDTSKNSVRTVNPGPGVRCWEKMELLMTKSYGGGGVCASGPPISKNHEKTSPHGAGLGEANNT